MKGVARLAGAVLTALLGVASAAQAQAPGAPVPFIEFNAATSSGVLTNGTVIGPSNYFGTLAAEATGREAVLLSGQGKYVSFTLSAPANAIDIHYAIPDAPTGGGITQPLSLYAGGSLVTSLTLTSAYSYLYGAYQFSKTPGIGMPGALAPHDYYNDARFMFSSTLPAGTVVKLQVDTGDNAPWYVINTADFEVVAPPLPAPANSINVTQAPYNINNLGTTDVTAALQKAINAGETSGQVVYLPQGTYTISQPLAVNHVTVQGAGEWYTVLTGRSVEFAGQIAPASTNVNISDLAIFGNVASRVDSDGSVNGFNGGLSNSTISNVWIQNTKVGAWIVGPATHLTFNNLRILDTKADGINFNAANGAIDTATVENTFFRNTQDDGIATWAENAGDTNITMNQNTILSPGLANNIAIYGSGAGDVISNNLLADPVTRGSCIHDGLRFSAVAATGPMTIQNNLLERCGQYDPGFYFGVGAIWFWPLDGNMNAAVNLSGNTIQDSPYSAYMFLSPYSTSGVTVNGDTVTGVGTFVVHAQGTGSATITNTPATGIAPGGGGFLTLGCTASSNLALTATGDTGWSSTPICNVPAAAPLWVYPDVVTFQTAAGKPLTEQVAVINAAYQSTNIGPIAASGGFTVAPDPLHPCGTSLAAAQFGGANEPGWCLVDISFNGSGSGITGGTLTIPNSAGKPVVVQLIGSTGGNTSITPPQVSPSSMSFGYLQVGSSSAAQTATLTNPAGSPTLSISSITATSGFTETNTCGSTLAAGSSCTISVKFAPTAGGTLAGSLAIAQGSSTIGVSLSGTGYTSTTNLALGATSSASSSAGGFPPSNAIDGNTSTYWEAGSAYPQTLTLNFGVTLPLGSVTLNLPPATSWSTRTETFSVQGSTNGTTYTTLVPSAGYTFNPATGNTVSFNLPANTSAQYLQLVFTANTGWTVAQLSEFAVFPGAAAPCTAGSPAATTHPGATAASSSSINLSWTASATSGVTYSIFRATNSGFTPSASNEIAGGLSGTSYSDTGLAASTTYYYIIEAVNCAGAADSSQVSAATPAGGPAPSPSPSPAAPSVPTGVSAAAGGGGTTMVLAWTASAGAAPITYNIYRGTSSGGESTIPVATGIATTTYSDTGLTSGTTYYYRVSAVNAVGASVESTEVHATPGSPSYQLSAASPAPASAASGSSATSSVTVTPVNGFTGTVTFGCSDSLLDVTCSGNANVTAGAVTAPVTMHVGASAIPGTDTVTITGTNNVSVSAAPITLDVTNTSSPCKAVSNSWMSQALTAQQGTFTAMFTVVPSANTINSVIALSDGAQSSYAALPVAARFNASGFIDAIDGTSGYSAASSIPYSGETAYSFEFDVNILAQTYTLYVTPAGGAKTLVGQNYGFGLRANVLDTVTSYAAVGSGELCGSLSVFERSARIPHSTWITTRKGP